ncbi:MAG: hypothetical protein E2O68_03385 [Deltaproteobacteria bacterium]|nr:MAG: hypothetical protein E2O68_03385 [Deltaproteobacteria bacterium]
MRFLILVISTSFFLNAFAGDEDIFNKIMFPLMKHISFLINAKNPSSVQLRKINRKIETAFGDKSIQKILKKDRPYGRRPLNRFRGVNQSLARSMSFKEKKNWIKYNFNSRRGFKKELSLLQIFRNTKGQDLFCLKQSIDNSESRNNMYQLIFDKVNDDLMRNLILFHFRFEAEKNKSKWITIPVSDLDDTAYNSFKDKRWPRRGLYPGFITTLETVIGSNRITTKMEIRDCTPGAVFLTGRGENFGRTLIPKLTKKGITVKKTVLFGSFPSMIATGFSNKPMADKKVKRMIGYSKIFPEKKYIMFGDNGQLDSRAYRKITKFTDRDNALVGYINNIRDDSYRNKINEWDFRGNKLIRVLDSYPQMVLDMYNSGFLTNKKKVKEALRKQVREIKLYSRDPKYIKKGGMRDYLLEGIKLYCKKIAHSKRDVCP